MVYSMNDLYPMSSSMLDTTSQTVAESDEQNRYSDNVVLNDAGQKSTVAKKHIWLGLGVLVCILVFFNLLKFKIEVWKYGRVSWNG